MSIKLYIGGRSTVISRDKNSKEFVRDFIYKHDINRIYTYYWLDKLDSFEKILKRREEIRDEEK